MARRRSVTKRKVLPDPLHGSRMISKMVTTVMRAGKRSVAEKIVYGALDDAVSRLTQKHAPLPEGAGVSSWSGGFLLEHILDALAPAVEVRPRRVGGSTYQVPVEVDRDRGLALAMRWLIKAAKARGERGMIRQLSSELLDALEGRGGAFKELQRVMSMVKSSQVYVHFRWGGNKKASSESAPRSSAFSEGDAAHV